MSICIKDQIQNMANISCVPFHFETRFTDSGEIETSSVMENLWKTYQKNYSYAVDVSWHIIMECIRDLYPTAFSDKFKVDFA